MLCLAYSFCLYEDPQACHRWRRAFAKSFGTAAAMPRYVFRLNRGCYIDGKRGGSGAERITTTAAIRISPRAGSPATLSSLADAESPQEKNSPSTTATAPMARARRAAAAHRNAAARSTSTRIAKTNATPTETTTHPRPLYVLRPPDRRAVSVDSLFALPTASVERFGRE
jgi:hypothetical protein